jgi:hypothetical protein
MSVAVSASPRSVPARLAAHSPRTQLLLHGPIVATLLRLAWLNGW